MKSLFKSLLFVSMLAMVFGGCKKSILEDEGGNTIDKNVRLRIYPYWNNYYFKTDSIYQVNGSFLQIDEISIVHSGFTFVNQGDTLDPGGVVAWKSGQGNEIYMGSLPAGSYSGHYFFKVGVDSISDARPPSFFPENSVLGSGEYYRGPLLGGYNYVAIKGKIVNPALPLLGPSIPMSWVIATQDLVTVYGSAKSFNVVPGRYVTIDINFDVAKLFTGLYPLQIPIIASNQNDGNDFAQATTLQQNFSKDAYKIAIQ